MRFLLFGNRAIELLLLQEGKKLLVRSIVYGETNRESVQATFSRSLEKNSKFFRIFSNELSNLRYIKKLYFHIGTKFVSFLNSSIFNTGNASFKIMVVTEFVVFEQHFRSF